MTPRYDDVAAQAIRRSHLHTHNADRAQTNHLCGARQIGRNRADSLDVRGISLLAVALHPGCGESCPVEWDSPASRGTLAFERVELHRGREVPSCPGQGVRECPRSPDDPRRKI